MVLTVIVRYHGRANGLTSQTPERRRRGMPKKRTEPGEAQTGEEKNAKAAPRGKKDGRSGEGGASFAKPPPSPPTARPSAQASERPTARDCAAGRGAASEPMAAGTGTEAPAQGPEYFARVARKAYELFERRGGEPGRDVEDWMEAERIVREELLHEGQQGTA